MKTADAMTPYARLALNIASAVFGVPTSLILGGCRKRRVSHARWAALALLKTRKLSSAQVGRGYGLDHTSVLHALKRIDRVDQEKMAQAQAEFSRCVKQIELFCVSVPKTPEPVPKPKPKKIVPPPPQTPDDIWAQLLGGCRTIAYSRRGINGHNPVDNRVLSAKTQANEHLTV